MMTYEDFVRILNEEVSLLPDYVHEELNGGVLAAPSTYLHPARLADNLYILGTYSVDSIFGKQIVLYYGSFVSSLGNTGEKVYRARIRETVRQEFLHHLESQAGPNKKGSLVEEDARRILEYYKSHAQ